MDPRASLLEMLGVSFVLGLLVLFLRLKFSKSDGKASNQKLPPGPRPWPILGNLPLLSAHLHQDFWKLSKTYGPIFHLRLGSVDAVVISSPTLAEEVLKTKDVAFGSRPRSSAGTIMVYDHSSVGLSPCGPYWRHARKVYTLELLTVRRIRQFEKERTAELLRVVESVLNGCKDGKAVNLEHVLWVILSNNIYKMTFSKTGSEDTSKKATVVETQSFEEAERDFARLFTAPVLGDFVPFLRNFDIGGYKRQMREVRRKMDEFFENIIEEHLTRPKTLNRIDSEADATGDDKQGLLDVLLTSVTSENESPLSREQVKALVLEVIGAGIDTQQVTLGWAFSELLKNPSILLRAQEELDNAVGNDRLVQEADLPHLPYIQAVVNETFRLHPTVPLLVPHVCSEASSLGDGYYIPKNTQVFINTWAMGRDPTLWEDPLEFNPERFLETDIDSSGKAFKFLPFGSGRRTCPGRLLGLTMVEYTLAALLHACSWALPQGVSPANLDMREAPGLTAPRMVPLEARASPRLPLSVIFATQ